MSQNQVEIVVEPVEPVITTRRVVNAPRALVWDCFTKPEHIRRWKAPRDLEMLVCECDVRIGGTWRAVYRRPNGQEFGFHGEFREVIAPERLVRTFVWFGATDEAIETIVLAESGPGKTLITTKTAYTTMAMRDGIVQSSIERGMESGTRDAYLRLDELIASLSRGTPARTS